VGYPITLLPAASRPLRDSLGDRIDCRSSTTALNRGKTYAVWVASPRKRDAWAVAAGCWVLAVYGSVRSPALRARLGKRDGRPEGGERMSGAAGDSDQATCGRFLGATQIIHGVSLEIESGERHAIIGPKRRGQEPRCST